MIGFFRRLRKNRKGNILVIAGAALPIVVGSAGMATDTIQWVLWKRQLQRAADSAAIAAVYDRVETGNADTVEETVLHDLTLNLHTGFDLVDPMTVAALMLAAGGLLVAGARRLERPTD